MSFYYDYYKHLLNLINHILYALVRPSLSYFAAFIKIKT